MRHLSFVLDANIYISYAITDTIIDLTKIVTYNTLNIYVCDEIYDEIIRVSKYPHLAKYKINGKELLNDINKFARYFPLKYPIKRYIPNDPHDDYVIALALQTNSGFVGSGDKDILDNKEALESKFKKLKILTLREFKDLFKA